MKAVQMSLSEDLISEVDRMAKRLGTTRSEFARRALQEALAQRLEEELELKHREGYLRHPVRRGEFDEWENEQGWGE
jgi:metal-responsive CopG/Arc/MetJ family transcriptional regulator